MYEKFCIVKADLHIHGFSIRGLPRPQKNGKLRNKQFISFKTRAKREPVVTWWNPAGPRTHASPQLTTVLLLAFSLFELVAVLSQCLCSENNKKMKSVNTHNKLRYFKK